MLEIESSPKVTQPFWSNSSTVAPDPVDDPTANLSQTEQERLVTILDQYMIDEEEGRHVDVEALLERNGDLRGALQHYLAGLKLVRELASPAQQPVPVPWQKSIRGDATWSGAPPARLGPYELGDTIGRGAMGIVYRAYDQHHQREVAVKVLAYGTLLDTSRIDRFRREAKTAALLDHPNVVPVYAVGCERGINYYAMQLIEGKSLDRWLELASRQSTSTEPKLPSQDELHLENPLLGPDRYRRIAQLAASAARALHAAHLAGVIHRDVKPSNLLLGNDGQLWVTDFGLARVQAETALTQAGELIGTVRYMSLEQAKGQGELIDARTDVYGLGATLYEMATQVPAFPGDDMIEVLRQVQSQEPIHPHRHDPHIPRDLETIILRAIRPRSCDRYPTAADLADDLQRFVAGRPIRAHGVRRHERMIAWARRHRGLTLSLMAAWVCLLVSSITTTVLVMRAQARTIAALNKSEDHYRQARSILDTLGASSAKRLADIPAADSVRQDILAQTIDYYEQFIASSVSDPLLRHDVARTRLEIASLTALSSDYDTASRAYRSALESLVHSNGDQTDSQLLGHLSHGAPDAGVRRHFREDLRPLLKSTPDLLLYVQTLNEWALLASEHGDQANAQTRLHLALDALTHHQPNSADDQLKLTLAKALSHNNLGVVELRQGQSAQSAQQIQQAIAMLEAIPKESLREAQLGADVADALSNFSVLLGQAQRYAEAAQVAEQSLAMRLATQPFRASESQTRTAITYNNLAAYHWKAQRGPQAITAYQRAVELLEEVIRHAPGRVESHHRLAVTLNNLGMALVTQDAIGRAEQVFERAETLAQTAVAADPSDVHAARRLASILNNHAVLLRNDQRLPEAEQRLRAAAELLSGLPSDETQHAQGQATSEQIQHNLDSLARQP